MAELHIDDDWKKQAQEEKRRLAEEEQKRSAERDQREGVAMAAAASASAATLDSSAPAAAGPEASRPAAGPARGHPAAGAGGTRERGAPEASVSALVNSLATQALLYLGVLAPRGAEPQIDLDMSKFNVDLLGILE